MPKPVYDPIIRVSKMNGRMESAESTMTLTDQRRATKGSIELRGGRIGRELKALDHSGFDVENNEALRTALARIRAGESQGVCFAYADRFARNMWQAGAFMQELARLDGDLIITGLEQIDYRTPIGRQMIANMIAAAETVYFAAKERGDRIADATLARGVPNRVPYGYVRNQGVDGVKADPELDGKALVPDPLRVPAVQMIFQMRRDGIGWQPIADALRAEGYKSPTGGHWTRGTLRRIVESPVYLGAVVLGKRRVDGAHKPVVTEALWRAAQSTRTYSRSGRLVGGIAQGLLVCSGCGSTLSVVSSGDGRTSYGCRRFHGSGECQRRVYVRKEVADLWVDSVIAGVIDRGEGARLVATAKELQAARAAVRGASDELEAFQRHGRATDPGYAGGLQDRREALEHAQAAHDELAARADEAADLPETGAEYHALDLRRRRRVARLLVDRVVVAPPISRSPNAAIVDRFGVAWR